MTTDKTQAEVDIPSVAALKRIADALERLADVYLYCNDPEGGEVPPDPDAKPLPPGFRGMR